MQHVVQRPYQYFEQNIMNIDDFSTNVRGNTISHTYKMNTNLTEDGHLSNANLKNDTLVKE